MVDVQIYTILQLPSTALQILNNIKIVLISDILENEDFYTDQNLKNFTGGTHILWPWRNADKISALISGLDQIVPPIYSGTISAPGLYYGITRWVDVNDLIKITISLTFNHPEISFEQVEKLFGTNWKDYPYFPSPFHSKIDPPTHPKGNAWVQYDLTQGRKAIIAVFGFAADGSLHQASIKEEVQQTSP